MDPMAEVIIVITLLIMVISIPIHQLIKYRAMYKRIKVDYDKLVFFYARALKRVQLYEAVMQTYACDKAIEEASKIELDEHCRQVTE